jgi:hypothetical protein
MDRVQYSDVLDSAARKPQAELRESTLGHREALEELWQVWYECREANWDGYDAFPVEKETYATAYMLIESLPLGFPRPSIGAEPDGHLTLEWYKSPRRTLSVSVDPNGLLHYAGLFGPNKRYGTVTFFSTAPDELIQLVRNL